MGNMYTMATGTGTLPDLREASFAWAEADFSPALPCEHRSHLTRHNPGQHAWALIEIIIDRCDEGTQYLICKSGWDLLKRATELRCDCLTGMHAKGEYTITVIEIIAPV